MLAGKAGINKRHRQLLGFVLIFISVISSAFAEDNALKNKKSELKSIANEISLIKKHLTFFQNKKTELKSSLSTIETNIGQTTSELRQTNNKLTQQKTLLSATQKQLNFYNQKLELQKQLLSQQIKAAYILGRQPFLKILLNQENPNKVMRYLEYYKYINQTRLKVIAEMQQTAFDIKNTSTKLTKQTQKLSSIQQEQQKQQTSLKSQHKERQQLLDKTELTIQNKTEQLNKLIADKKNLETIILTLSQAQAFGYFPGASFSQMKGKLHWPMNNHPKVLQTFNQPIAFGRLHSSGILLAAHAGENVYAIFPGKVIFADWLHGFGLLIILQHSDGYLSLCARNQSLEVKTGDIVQPGQVIATAGNSGGYQTPALYFEIRHSSTPVNPLIWLQKS